MEYPFKTFQSSSERFSFKAKISLVFHLLMPIIIFPIIISTYPELSPSNFTRILAGTIPLAVAMILIAQYQVRYAIGTKGRLYSNIVYVALAGLWVYAFSGWGTVIHQSWEGYEFELHIARYLMLILFILSINALYYAYEYYSISALEKHVEKKGSDSIRSPTQTGTVTT